MHPQNLYAKTETGQITTIAFIFVSGREAKLANLNLLPKRKLWLCLRELKGTSSVSRTSFGFGILITNGLGIEMLQGQTPSLAFDPLDIKIRPPIFSERGLTKGIKTDMSITLDFELLPDSVSNILSVAFPDTFWYSEEVVAQVGLAPGYSTRMRYSNVVEVFPSSSSSSQLLTSQSVTLLFRNVL